MSSKFTTPLILSSALMLGALGFMACGDDSGTDVPNPPTPTSSSGGHWIPPEPTAISSIDFHDDLGVSAISPTKIKFKGTIGINIDDSVSVEDQAMVRFVGLNIAVVNSAGIITGNYHFNNSYYDHNNDRSSYNYHNSCSHNDFDSSSYNNDNNCCTYDFNCHIVNNFCDNSACVNYND